MHFAQYHSSLTGEITKFLSSGYLGLRLRAETLTVGI